MLLGIVVLGLLMVNFAQAHNFYETGIKKNIEWKFVDLKETFENSRYIKNKFELRLLCNTSLQLA